MCTPFFYIYYIMFALILKCTHVYGIIQLCTNDKGCVLDYMKNKKVLIGISTIFVIAIFAITLSLALFKSEENIVLSDNDKNLINNSFLTLMLEQSDGTYKESTSNTWPGDGYIFNKELSACENGGELDFDSENNKVILYSNKSDGCYIYFDIYNKPIINSINLSEVTNNSITINVTTTEGTNPISNYYYIINDGVPVSTTNNTYTFSGLDSNTTYTIKVYVVDTLGYSSEISNLNVETEEATLLADWVINEYNGTQGNNGIYNHTSSLANSAGDNSYRYSGANPNNYVCFGSDEATCPSDNLYRIIGVFGDEVKLIKNTSIGNYAWHSGSDNTWNSSTKPDIRNTLKSTFLGTLNSTWQNKIATHAYKVGGMAYSSTNTAKEYYNTEVGSSSSSTTDSMKIGLMYVSDFGFAASPDYWTTELNNYIPAKSSNWLAGLSEWTISRRSDSTFIAFRVHSAGIVIDFSVDDANAVRPVFYLNSNVQYSSGTGTESDPIRLVV